MLSFDIFTAVEVGDGSCKTQDPIIASARKINPILLILCSGVAGVLIYGL
jgi:hypothetical protein